MRSRRRRWWLGVLAALALLPCACDGQDADRLARIGRKAADKFQIASGGAPAKLAGGLQAMRANLDEMALDSRVSARLRWDKSLANAQISVQAKGNVVELKGQVADLAQRRRAVELAETTTGVEQVKDELTIPEKHP